MGGFPAKGPGDERIIVGKDFETPESLRGWKYDNREDGTVIYAFYEEEKTLRVNKELYPGWVEMKARTDMGRAIRGRGISIELTVHNPYPLKGIAGIRFSDVKKVGYLSREQKKLSVTDKKQR